MTIVGIPGIAVPLPLPVPIVMPIVNDTGDSGSTNIDRSVTVYVDIDNPQVIDGDAFAREGQRALATILLLLGLPLAAVAVVLILRRGRGGGGAAPAGPGGWPAPPGPRRLAGSARGLTTGAATRARPRWHLGLLPARHVTSGCTAARAVPAA